MNVAGSNGSLATRCRGRWLTAIALVAASAGPPVAARSSVRDDLGAALRTLDALDLSVGADLSILDAMFRSAVVDAQIVQVRIVQLYEDHLASGGGEGDFVLPADVIQAKSYHGSIARASFMRACEASASPAVLRWLQSVYAGFPVYRSSILEHLRRQRGRTVCAWVRSLLATTPLDAPEYPSIVDCHLARLTASCTEAEPDPVLAYYDGASETVAREIIHRLPASSRVRTFLFDVVRERGAQAPAAAQKLLRCASSFGGKALYQDILSSTSLTPTSALDRRILEMAIRTLSSASQELKVEVLSAQPQLVPAIESRLLAAEPEALGEIHQCTQYLWRLAGRRHLSDFAERAPAHVAAMLRSIAAQLPPATAFDYERK